MLLETRGDYLFADSLNRNLQDLTKAIDGLNKRSVGVWRGDDSDQLEPEFVGEIIDIFDDFLEARNIRVSSSDEQLWACGELLDSNSARIYGSDYDELVNALTILFRNWRSAGK